jgi:hypothetical protein
MHQAAGVLTLVQHARLLRQQLLQLSFTSAADASVVVHSSQISELPDVLVPVKQRCHISQLVVGCFTTIFCVLLLCAASRAAGDCH